MKNILQFIVIQTKNWIKKKQLYRIILNHLHIF